LLDFFSAAFFFARIRFSTASYCGFRPAARTRSGRPRIVSSRCASLIEPQRAISSSERPHPEQSRDAESITQILMQGDEIIAPF
jgi:hypothetical protein